MKNIRNGKECRSVKKARRADRSKRTLHFSPKLKGVLKNFRSVQAMIDQTKIVQFVERIETKKKFVRNPDKIFRHLASELGELDGAMFELEKSSEPGAEVVPEGIRFFQKKIGDELWDLIFLCCYMADVYGVDLNRTVNGRMAAIARQYDVSWPARKEKRCMEF